MDTATNLRATCECTAPIMLRAGRVVCATCGAPIESGVPETKPDVYSSEGPLPPRCSHRSFLERVRTMPEAHRVGGKRGRGVVWTISRAAWEAGKAPAPKGAGASNVVSIDTLIEGAGYRATKRAS